MQIQKNILIVEDEEAHLELILRGFESNSNFHLLKSALSLKLANEIINDSVPDLVISDWRLPDGDGTSLIRCDETGKPLYPVIIMTSFGNENFAVEALRLGALDYIVKSPEIFADMLHIAHRGLREWEHIVTRKKAEEQIRKLSSAVEQSKVSVVITNTKGEVEYVNPAFEEITGYTIEEIYGKNLNILKSGYTSKDEYKSLWETIKSGKEWKGEFLNRKKNGKLYWELASISPIVINGQIANFLGIKEDITYRKQIELELKTALDKAEEASTLKSVLLQNMNHELRTPMMGIIGIAQMIKNESKEGFITSLSEKILKSSKRLMNTLNAILDLSEIEANKHDMTLIKMNIIRCIEKIVSGLKDEASVKNLFIDFVPNKEIDTLYIDERLFNQILVNLIDNAIKYTKFGGIKIKTDRLFREGTQYAAISITDTGIGIEKANFDKIFKEFRQESEGFRRSFEGTGLGLTIAKKMAKLMKGDIFLESIINKGSTFTLIIPMHLEDIHSKNETYNNIELPKISELKLLQRKNVLVVEDNIINKEVIEYFLKDYCSVDYSLNGFDALEKCKLQKFDLILMDINLGEGIDGVETLTKLRRIPNYETIPVVAVTGVASFSTRPKLTSAGFIEIIIKPFDQEKLLEILKKIKFLG